MKLVFGECSSRKVTVRITIDAGSNVEYKKWTPGIAHIVEHMMFQGSNHYTHGELMKNLAALGVESNAYTSHDRVCFYINVPIENAFPATELLADMMFNRKFKEIDLIKEKLVVLEEERGRRDNIDNVIVEELDRFLCKGPLAIPIIGTEESISSVTLEEVQKFYDYYYKPGNMLVTITGPKDLDYEKLGLIFGLNSDKFKRSRVEPNINNKRKKLVMETNVQQAKIFLCYNTCSMGGKDGLILNFMAKFFSNGMDSRLFEEIRQKHGLCYYINSLVALERDIGWFIINTGVAQENMKKTIKLIDEEIDKLIKYGPTDEEIERAKNKYISEIYSCIETSYGLNAVLDAKTYNKLPPLEKSLERIKGMTKKKIVATCKKTFTKENRRIFVCIPKEEE